MHILAGTWTLVPRAKILLKVPLGFADIPLMKRLHFQDWNNDTLFRGLRPPRVHSYVSPAQRET